jgi:asparagine synthase (glutamine-hydrolysing)
MVPRIAPFTTLASLLPRFVKERLVRGSSRLSPGGRLVRAAAAGPGLEGAYFALRGLLAPAEIAALVDSREAPAPERPGFHADHAELSPVERVGMLELSNYLPDQLLRDTDSVSMAHSLEVRVPLLDDVVVRAVLAIPAPRRLAPGKRLLANAAGIAGSEPKRPFALPFAAWTRGPLKDALREGLLSEQLPFASLLLSRERARLWHAFVSGRAHWSRLWALATLRHWPSANGFAW